MLLAINRMSIAMAGGISLSENNIRPGQTLGFVDRIYDNSVFGQQIYDDIFSQAAAYLFYILKNHTFHDGNKRTGLAAAIAFLEWNNIRFAPLNEDHIFDFIIEIASGPNDPDTIIPYVAKWLKKMSLC